MATTYTTTVKIRSTGRPADDVERALRSVLTGLEWVVHRDGEDITVDVPIDANDTSEAELAARDAVQRALERAGLDRETTAAAVDTKSVS